MTSIYIRTDGSGNSQGKGRIATCCLSSRETGQHMAADALATKNYIERKGMATMEIIIIGQTQSWDRAVLRC